MTAVQPITGPTGAGAIGVDVWASQGNPGAVTDWGAIVNTLATGGTKLLLFSEHEFPCTTQINLSALSDVTLEGASGFLWPTPGTNIAKSRLVWNGTGTTPFITTRTGGGAFGGSGTTIRNLGIYYSSNSFTGKLVDFAVAGAGLIENCQLASLHLGDMGYYQTASCLVSLQDAVGVTLRNCSMRSAAWCIRGQETGHTVCNAVQIEDCVFDACSAGLIANPGIQWVIDGCTFEFETASSTGPPLIGIGSDVTSNCQFTVTNCGFWDPATTALVAVDQPVGMTWQNVVFDGNYFHTFTPASLKLNGLGSNLTVVNNQFDTTTGQQATVIDFGNSGTALKRKATIKGNARAANNPMTFTNLAGHGDIEIDNGGGGTNLRTVDGYERNGYAQPAIGIAAHAGAPNISSVEIHGNDTAGWLAITMTGGGSSGTGLLADVTFGTTPVQASGAPTAHPIVILTPLEIVTYIKATDSAASQVYASVPNTGVTGFNVGVNVAIPATKRVGYAYRVIQL